MINPLLKSIVVIPAYNEAKCIESIVSSSLKYIKKVIVIDDCSSDNTINIAKKAGADVIRHNENLGNSLSLKSGIAFGLKLNYDYIVTIDGDNAHNPDEIYDLLNFHCKHNNDLTIGNRFHTTNLSNVPSHKLYANMFVKELFNLIFNTNFPDVACGFRVLSKKLAKLIMNTESIGYGFVYDCLVEAISTKCKIGFGPISVRYDASEYNFTKKTELFDVLQTYSKFPIKDLLVKQNINSLIIDVQAEKPFSISFNGTLICVLPIKNSYIFQKQNDIFRNKVIGNIYSFDNV